MSGAKSLFLRLPRKRHKTNSGDVFDGHFAVRLFRQALQYLHVVLRADGDDHAAADRELVDQWLRHFVGCSRDDDCIEEEIFGDSNDRYAVCMQQLYDTFMKLYDSYVTTIRLIAISRDWRKD